MVHKPTTPPQPPAAVESDDPWAAVSDETRRSLHSQPVARPVAPSAPGGQGQIEVGHHDSDAARTGVSTELVDLLTDSIALAPERADLWMMRFEMFRALGMKPEFSAALLDAWSKPRVRRVLDWVPIKALWDNLAPGESMPEGVTPVLPKAAPAVTPSGGARRFADIAAQVAGAELDGLTKAYATLRAQPGFYSGFARHLAPILARPSPLVHSEALTRAFGGMARIYLKREDKLRHSPELVNAAAQAHIATILGKRALVTGNDVDGHSMMLATIAPRFGLSVLVLVREQDLEAKADLLARLRARGCALDSTASQPHTVSNDPREAALHHWRARQGEFHLALSLGTGPRPYPTMVSDFQSLLGRETVLQLRSQTGMARPWSFVAAVYSEADSIGFMLPHLGVPQIQLHYAEPDHDSAAVRSSTRARAYNGHRREHAWLKGSGRFGYGVIPDAQARAAQEQVKQLEGCEISLEDARALVEAERLARSSTVERDIVVLLA